MAKSTRDLEGSLKFRFERRDGVNWIAIAGEVDEASDFTPIMRMTGRAVIDLGAVKRINSMGVHNWITFVRHCEKVGVDLTFERCPPVLVGQMSMIRNFMGTEPHVRSVLVPYSCPACGRAHEELLVIAAGAAVQPTVACPSCKSSMQLEELPETYDEVLRRL